jgi:hypothetical protein
MSNENIETNAPANSRPQQPQHVCELPSLEGIRTQAIMAAILFAFRGGSHDATNLRDTMYMKELKASAWIAADLLDRLEQRERHYLENCLIDESGQPETEPQR